MCWESIQSKKNRNGSKKEFLRQRKKFNDIMPQDPEIGKTIRGIDA